MANLCLDAVDLSLQRRDKERRFQLEVPAFHIVPGDRVALVGASGSGKSTLIELLAGARAPGKSGSLNLNLPEFAEGPIDLVELWQRRDEQALSLLRRTSFGYVQQSGGLLGFLSVKENIALSGGLSGRQDKEYFAWLVDCLGLGSLLNAYPANLSGGQRQRVVIASAMVHRPAIVCADEPTASLDRENGARVMDLMCAAADEAGAALIVASHDVSLLSDYSFDLCEPEFERLPDGIVSRFSRRWQGDAARAQERESQ